MESFTKKSVSRRQALGIGVGIASTAFLAGCTAGTSDVGSGTTGGLVLPAHIDPPVPAGAGAIISKVPGVPPAYANFPAKFFRSVDSVPGSGGTINSFQITWSPPPTPLNDNKFWQSMNKRLGVNYNTIQVPAQFYDEKFSTMLASGNIPDLVQLMNTAASNTAMRQGAFADLAPVLSGKKILKYKNLANIQPDQWKSSSFDGKIYGVPIDLAGINNMYHYRKDWAEKLGYPDAPKNADEVLEIFSGMSKMGVQGRYGFSSFPDAPADMANSMFGVPNQWRLENNKLTNQIETPEYEQSVAYLRKLWNAGAFNPNALALGAQQNKALAMIPAGSVGLAWVSLGTWYWPGVYRTAWEALGDAWATLIPPGHDGKKSPVFYRSNGWFGRVAVSAKSAKDPKRLDEILRVLNYLRAPFGSVERHFLTYGDEGMFFTKNGQDTPKAVAGTDTAWAADGADALTYGVGPVFYQWPNVAEAVKVQETQVRASVINPAASLQSPTADKVSAQMTSLATEYVNRIVVGSRPLADLREYQEKWRSGGGDAMRKEYETALKKQQDA